ncbi:MAG: hypothetical protein KGI54_16375 [Pseudomonadota bacterium]|nr:hypothetical protein [Pseudomonadota bacterium]
MVSYTSAPFIVTILAAVFLLFIGGIMSQESGGIRFVLILKVAPVVLAFALGLVAFKII